MITGVRSEVSDWSDCEVRGGNEGSDDVIMVETGCSWP